jgi:esterase/lipase superfamily enzyme
MSDTSLLTLEVVRFIDMQHWDWRLKNSRGRVLGERAVELDATAPEYAGFLDLDTYLRDNAAPDNRRNDERRLLAEVGAWIGRRVLGPIANRITETRTPTVVRVVVPVETASASTLLYRPLELAHVDGQPLALQDVSFVFELDEIGSRTLPRRHSGQLRMLAVFSLPSGTGPLALRQERFQLQQLIGQLAETRQIELHVLQFGATYDELQRKLTQGKGWDIVHFAGHGRAASLILEAIDGGRRIVTSEEIVSLLRGTRKRLQWVTLSTCLSGADVISETRTWLGLEPEREDPEIERAERAATLDAERQLPGLASAIMRELDCAVLAMRYPVGDAFASSLGSRVYRGVIEDAQSLPRALQLALPTAVETTDARPLSVTTPALFGERALRLGLRPAPRRRGQKSGPSLSVVDLPRPPVHFVGRTAEMIRASAALARGSSYSAVLFYGMAGAGKTSCALELAHHFRDLERFRGFVWFAAPEAGQDIATSLRAFAQRWDVHVQALAGPHGQVQAPLVGTVEADDLMFNGSLQRLKDDLRTAPVLIVLDNIESLLSNDGSWIVPRWERLIAAMITAEGGSRLVLTSRIRPSFATDAFGTDGAARVMEMPIHALSLNEGLLLARQLPNLGALIRREAAADENTRREHLTLVTDTLRVTQGHPKLIALAESQAADPARLKTLVDEALHASYVGGKQLSAFFAEGASSLDPEQFFAALGAWTRNVAGALDPNTRIAFECLCRLEQKDRRETTFGAVWSDVWHRLGHSGAPPDRELAVDGLRRAALIEARTDGSTLYDIHPGIAETTGEGVPTTFREAVDGAAASYWKAIFDHGLEEDARGRGRDVVEAGLSAAPYLLRLGRWGEAAELLEEVRYRDESAATTAAAVPFLKRVVRETAHDEHAARYVRILGGALLDAGQIREAEVNLREAAERSAKRSQHREASVALDELIDLLRRTGRSQEALAVWDRMNGHTIAAGLGPWSQLVDNVWRLLLLHDIGRDEEALQLAEQYREETCNLPETSDQPEATTPWTVRELLFEGGRVAALGLGHWDQALIWNARSIESQRKRKAPDLEVARLRINDCDALVELGRDQQARDVALDCRKIFEGESSAVDIAAAFSALAKVEGARGNGRRAIAHERTALRHRYSEQSPDPETCAESHFRLASYLARQNLRTAAAANRLACALIRIRTVSVDTPQIRRTLGELGTDIARLLPSDPPVPMHFDKLATFIGETEGVSYGALFDSLPTERDMDGEAAIRLVLGRVASGATGHPEPALIGEHDAAPAGEPSDGSVTEPNPDQIADMDTPTQWSALDDQERRIRVVGQQPLPVGSERATEHCTFPLYYATDRGRVSGEGRPAYGGQADVGLHFGVVRVSVPYRREMATIKRPRWWLLQFSDRPRQHITLLNGSEFSQTEFCGRLAEAIRAAEQPDAFVFIHGYNVNFDDAVRRTAQIAFDLHFEGAPILYSWPSAGRVRSYFTDGENARVSAIRLHAFLRIILAEVGAQTVHVIAHSMGNRVLLEALRDLDPSTLPADAAVLRELVFAAPDVRSDTFCALFAQARACARRFTLYASSADQALKLAMDLQGGYPRAGYAGDDILVLDGIDTIDASNVETDFLDHSYFGSSKSVVNDLFQLVRNGQTPIERGLQRLERAGLPYWVVPA